MCPTILTTSTMDNGYHVKGNIREPLGNFVWLGCNRYWHSQIKISLGRCFLKYENQKQLKLWWWLRYGYSIWRALGLQHHFWGYISQWKYHYGKQRLGTILSTHLDTHWWWKIYYLTKKNINDHKYHLPQNYWEDWDL